MKYSKEELAELAKGVFKDDKESPSIHADAEGTFRNSKQYDALSDEDKKKFPHEFKNPNVKASAPASAAADPATEKKLVAAEKEIARLNGIKSVKDAKATLDAKDAEIADLKTQLEAAKAALPKP